MKALTYAVVSMTVHSYVDLIAKNGEEPNRHGASWVIAPPMYHLAQERDSGS